MSYLKTPAEVAQIKAGGRIMGKILEKLAAMVQPGISAFEIDQAAERLIWEAGGRPAFKGYRPRPSDIPFPGTVCVCVNDELVHGIPTKEKVFKDGEIVSLDIGMQWPALSSEFRVQSSEDQLTRHSPNAERPARNATHSVAGGRTPNSSKGYFTDTALTVAVGEVAEETKKLLEVTKQALEIGIEQCRSGHTIADIGRAIEIYVRAQGEYGIVRDLVGHGVGHQPHEEPAVPNYYSREFERWKLEPGVVIAIEPMITLGGPEIITDPDRWTIRTKDRSWCAHFEHTVVVTEGGPVVATRRPNEL